MSYTETESLIFKDAPRSNFSSGTQRLLLEAARQNSIPLDQIIKREAYGTTLTVDGKLPSPDSGNYKIVVEGNLDLFRSAKKFEASDLPAFLKVGGDLRISSEIFFHKDPSKSLDVSRNIILVFPSSFGDTEKQRYRDEVALQQGVSFDGEIVFEMEKSPEDDVEKHRETKEAFVSRLVLMTREQFATYLIEDSMEYGDRTNELMLRRGVGPSGTLYGILARRAELRGISFSEMQKITELSDDERDGFDQVMRSIRDEWSTTSHASIKFEVGNFGYMHWRFGTLPSSDRVEKAYITLRDPIHQLTAEAMDKAVQAIEATGFVGQCKVGYSADTMRSRCDNIVIHGSNIDAVQRARDAAVVELTMNGVNVSAIDQGYDEKIAGQMVSHNQILANQISRALLAKKHAV